MGGLKIGIFTLILKYSYNGCPIAKVEPFLWILLYKPASRDFAARLFGDGEEGYLDIYTKNFSIFYGSHLFFLELSMGHTCVGRGFLLFYFWNFGGAKRKHGSLGPKFALAVQMLKII